MRILIAPDKFKGSLGAGDVGAAIARGLQSARPTAQLEIVALADGGEGTAEAVRSALGGEWVVAAAHDALGRVQPGRYAWLPGPRLAVMEMSAAAGLSQLVPNERDPTRASTFGVGEMLRDAAERGAVEIIVGLGGSATNDGGFGMARALGFQFFDARDHELGGPVSNLLNLARIVPPGRLSLPAITAACDVNNGNSRIQLVAPGGRRGGDLCQR
jgi:glycerate kinase